MLNIFESDSTVFLRLFFMVFAFPVFMDACDFRLRTQSLGILFMGTLCGVGEGTVNSGSL